MGMGGEDLLKVSREAEGDVLGGGTERAKDAEAGSIGEFGAERYRRRNVTESKLALLTA